MTLTTPKRLMALLLALGLALAPVHALADDASGQVGPPAPTEEHATGYIPDDLPALSIHEGTDGKGQGGASDEGELPRSYSSAEEGLVTGTRAATARAGRSRRSQP